MGNSPSVTGRPGRLPDEGGADRLADMKVSERSCPDVTTERPDRNIAVRRQRKALMDHHGGGPGGRISASCSIGNGVSSGSTGGCDGTTP